MDSKIGILGGTLNPIHNGHLIIAQSALEQFELDKVLIMPTGNPPHKQLSEIETVNHRIEMIKYAIEGNDKFVFSDLELVRDGIIYTSDTLKILHDMYNDTEIYFIMGADSLFGIEGWHCPEKIFEQAVIIVADRVGSYLNEDNSLNNQIKYLKEKYHADIRKIELPIIEISSSDIRNRLKSGNSIRYFLPEKERLYIYETGLYRVLN